MREKELTEGSSFLLSKLSHYNRWMAEQLNRLGPISGTVLEFGCGSGGMTQALVHLSGVERVIANDISPHVKEFLLEKFEGVTTIKFSDANILEDPQAFADMRYDWAVSSNTLEHIEDDKTALRWIVEYARLKTALILVPAFNCLYGTCDRDGGHLRRYSKASFRKLARDAGLEVNGLFYFNILGAFAWWTQYVFLRQQNYSEESHTYSYSFFDRYIVPFYSRVERRLNCPFGLSLVARVTLPDHTRKA